MQPFRAGSGTVNIAAGTTSGRVQITSSTGLGEYRVYNSGASTVFIKEGDGTVTATTSDLPIPAGAVEVLSFGSTYIAAITATGTCTIYFTPGDGI